MLTGCKKNDDVPNSSEWKGTGIANFLDYEPQADKVVRLFYYVPQNATATTPIVLVFHGAERNALEYRNALVNKANALGFIAVVPEFSEVNFPDVNGYNLGNVYLDGDQPSPATLYPESKWAFSLVEPIFSFVKNKTKNNSAKYHIIGHSAGAQFVHRFLFFKPSARFDRVIVSAAGWYTATSPNITFPYGFLGSPLANLNLEPLFQHKIIVQVGTSDNNPNASTLRHTPEADAQGLHRLARAQYFYNTAYVMADSLGLPFNWELRLIPGLNHDYVDAVGHAADLLFP